MKDSRITGGPTCKQPSFNSGSSLETASNMPLSISGRIGPSFCGDCLAIVATNCTVVTLRSTGTEGPHEGEIQSRWTDVKTESGDVGIKFAASDSV